LAEESFGGLVGSFREGVNRGELSGAIAAVKAAWASLSARANVAKRIEGRDRRCNELSTVSPSGASRVEQQSGGVAVVRRGVDGYVPF
jgi:hypothetical protein